MRGHRPGEGVGAREQNHQALVGDTLEIGGERGEVMTAPINDRAGTCVREREHACAIASSVSHCPGNRRTVQVITAG